MVRHGFRSARILGEVAGVIALLAGIAVAGLAWRMSRGPLDVTGIARLATAHWAPGLALGKVTLALHGRELHVAITGARADAAADSPTMDSATAALETLPLIRGALRPREVTADGIRLHFVRASDGRFSVKGIRGSFSLNEPRRTPGAPDQSDDSEYPDILRGLAHVALHGAALSLADQATGQTAILRDLDTDLRRDMRGALAGHGEATLAVGDVSSAINVDAARPPGDTPVSVHVAIGAVNPAALAPLAPQLAPLAALDAPVAMNGDFTVSPGFDLQHAKLHAEAGPGRAFLPRKGGGTAPAAFAAIALDAEGDGHAIKLTGLRVVLAPPAPSPPMTALLTGDAVRDPGHAVAHLHLSLDHGQMADLGAIWPVGVGGGARPWLVENVVTGTVHDGAFDLTLESGATLADIALTAATGTLQADDVTLYWLRPVPPIAFPHVLLTLVDPDTLTLAAPIGHQGALLGKASFMRIWGLSVKDQFSQIDTDVTAPIADVFALLQHPRLKLLSVHPLPISGETGQSATHLTIKLPLESKVTMDSVDIHATAHLTDVRVPRFALGRLLEAGTFDVDITQQGLTLGGPARLSGFPSTLTVGLDFRNGGPDQIIEHATINARADDKALTAAGLDTIGLLSGAVAIKLDYAEQRDGHAVVQGSADLAAARLSTPLGWSKPSGPAASVAAQAALDHGRLVGFDQIQADGPGLSVRGRSELVDGYPSILHVEKCVIGKTSMAGTVTFPVKPGEALRVTMAGPQLDISGPLGSKTAFEPDTPDTAPPGRPYRVDLRFDRLLLSETGAGAGPVTLSASGDARRIAQGRLVSDGPEKLDARIEPRGDGRHLTVTIGDLGLLLQRLGTGAGINQGAVALNGDFDDRRAGSPLAGTANVTRFGVTGVSVLGKVLQGLTLYGVVDALRGPGLVFDQLTLPFSFANATLDVQDARAYSSSLGLTAAGRLDLRSHTLNMTGTIVPAYFFNTLPGRVPLIGRFLSPESGGGVFAATYAVRGRLDDPSVSVNPLATLTPGVLRGLFGLFD